MTDRNDTIRECAARMGVSEDDAAAALKRAEQSVTPCCAATRCSEPATAMARAKRRSVVEALDGPRVGVPLCERHVEQYVGYGWERTEAKP